MLVALGAKAFTQIYLKDEKGARETLSLAKEIAQKQGFVPPVLDGVRIESQICHDLILFERALNEKDKTFMSEIKMRAYKNI